MKPTPLLRGWYQSLLKKLYDLILLESFILTMKDPKPPEHGPADGKPSLFKSSQCPYTVISSDIGISGVRSLAIPAEEKIGSEEVNFPVVIWSPFLL